MTKEKQIKKSPGFIAVDLGDINIDRKLAAAAKILGSINTREDPEAESSVNELLAIIKDYRGGKAEV